MNQEAALRCRGALRGTSVGLTFSVTVFSSMTTLPMSVRPGRSYIVSRRTSSRIARKPARPVRAASPESAIAVSAVVGELELDVLEAEDLLVLLDERVLAARMRIDERLAVERSTAPTIGSVR